MQYSRFCFHLIIAALLSSPTADAALSIIDSSKVNADSLTKAALALHMNGHYLDAVATFLRAGSDTGWAADRFNSILDQSMTISPTFQPRLATIASA